MPRRRPNSRAQQVAPKRSPGEPPRRRRDPQPPGGPAAGRSEGWAASPGGSEWWQGSSGAPSPTAPRVACGPPPRTPPAPTAAPRAAWKRTGLRGAPTPGPGECEEDRRGSAVEAQDSLGGLLGQLLPTNVQKFLHHLGVQWVELLQPETSEWPRPRVASEHWWGHSPQSPDCASLPPLRCQPSSFRNSLKKISDHQIPTLAPLRRDHAQFLEVKDPYGLRAPKLKTALSQSSSDNSPGHYRRPCPFRVRFADETLQDTAIRYWERSRAFQQGIAEDRPALLPVPSEPVFGGIRRWLQSLPRALHSRPKGEPTASSPVSWDRPGLAPWELQNRCSEDTFPNSSLSVTPRTTALRPQTDLETFLGTHNILEQVGKSPRCWSQKLESILPHLELKRGRPRGYHLLLPPAVQQ